jgi:hypothetical protein
MEQRLRGILAAVTLCAVMLIGSVSAQSEPAAAPDAAALAKQLSNPIASLVSIPFQFNWENGVGPNNDVRYILNVQPMAPFRLSQKMNLIGRWIMPYVSQPVLLPGGEPVSGYADIVASAFFSPVGTGSVTWGLGPVFSLPTTTNPLLGSGKYSAGPTFVILTQQGKVTLGVLANHLWSFANTGDSERADVNTTFLNPFFAYSLPKAVTITLSSEPTANWKAVGDEWTVPVKLSLSKVTKLGPFPFSVGGGVALYAQTPEGGPDWKLQTQFTLILPPGK